MDLIFLQGRLKTSKLTIVLCVGDCQERKSNWGGIVQGT